MRHLEGISPVSPSTDDASLLLLRRVDLHLKIEGNGAGCCLHAELRCQLLSWRISPLHSCAVGVPNSGLTVVQAAAEYLEPLTGRGKGCQLWWAVLALIFIRVQPPPNRVDRGFGSQADTCALLAARPLVGAAVQHSSLFSG